MEDNLENKQALLRKEVLEGGLNAQEFIEYLGQLKNEGQNVDLEHWNITELETAIKTFKTKREENKQSVMNLRMSLNLFRKSKIFESVLKKEKVFYENTQLWDYETMELQDCSKTDVNLKIPSDERPKVTIEKWEVKSVGGFIFGIGSRNELHLTISTNFTENRVVRKSEDVDWLKDILNVDYPGYFLPYIEKDRQLNEDDKKGIASRIHETQLFLNKIMKNSAFYCSKHVQVFFEEYNHKRFTEFRNREALLETVRDSDVLQTSTGTILVQISDKMNKTIKSGSSLGAEFNNLYNDFSNCSYKIVSYMEKIKKQIGFMYNICNKLGEKYTEAEGIFKIDDSKLPTIFLSFSNISSNLFRNLERHMKAFTDLTDGFTKNISRDWNEFIHHDCKVQKEHKRYLSEKEYLLKKKERCVSELSKWQLPESEYLLMKSRDLTQMSKDQKYEKMFPNDNENESRYKIWLANFNFNYVESYKVFLKEQEKCLLEKYLPYSGEATCVCKDMITNLAEFNEMIFS